MISYEIIGRLIDRLTADAHNETGSVQAYALDLLSDLGIPAPADPECSGGALCRVHPDLKWRHTSTNYASGQVVVSSRSEPDPFDAAIDINAMWSARRVLGSIGLGNMPDEVFDQALRESVDPPRLPVKSAPVDLSGFGRFPFEAMYNSPCAATQCDWVSEGELIINTPDGFMHWECAEQEYPEEIAQIEKRNT